MGLDLNSRYPTQTNGPSGAYPYGSARNITVPNDGTGTPWEEDIVNDIIGFEQELLDKAGIVPSGSADEVDASDYYNAMRLTAGHPGLIVPMALNVTPASLGLRALLLDGSGVLVANYPDLEDVTYIGDVDNPTADAFFRADDAAGTARNTAGAYLILPDMRGRFLRGLDLSGVFDPDGTSRIVGNEQNNSLQQHNHVVQNATPTFYQVEGVFGNTGGSPNVTVISKDNSKATADQEASSDDCGNLISGFTNILGVGNVTSETRSQNMAINFGIWF